MRGLPGSIRLELLGACCRTTTSVWEEFLEDVVSCMSVCMHENRKNVAYAFLRVSVLSCPGSSMKRRCCNCSDV